jgi:hypothetical protein
MITQLSQLSKGGQYYVCFGPQAKLAKRIKLIGIINEEINFKSDKTELYFEMFWSKTRSSTNLVYAQEIGIGMTKLEAKKNYGKFNYEKIHNAYKSYDEIDG